MSGSVSHLYMDRGRRVALWLLILAALIASFRTLNLDIETLITGIPYALSLIGDMFPPDFSRWKKMALLTAETISIGFWGTVFGMIFSLPLGFLSAHNTSPNAVVYYLSKTLVNILRAIPDILYAIIFVISLGMGPVAGVLALTVATTGMLSKFYAESVESIDIKAVEAVRATGAYGLSVIRHSVLPQVFPLFMGYNLYLLDHNIRVAMAIGIVGAGGLGVELFTQMRSFHYRNVSAILIIIFLIISVIDRISAYLRKAVIDGTFLSKEKKIKDIVFLTGIAIVSVVSLFFIPVSLNEIVRGIPRIGWFLRGLIPPDLSDLPNYVRLMLETIAIGICGTALAIVISIPLGMLSARNITNSPVIYNMAREIVNFFRAMPELVFALIFIAAVGLGPFSGVLSISLHTSGLLSKFYAEAIENVDPNPVEAVEATGANFLQKIRHSIMPMVLPLFNSYNLYLLDRNIRASTVLGIVGAGGIGFELIMSTRLFEYEKTAMVILVILVTIITVDALSSYLRKRVV